MGRIVKLLVAVAVLALLWKTVLPRLMNKEEEAAEITGGGDASCVRGAERASEAWGSGLRQFVNPPYDLEAWGIFRSEIETQIDATEAACSCQDTSCEKAGGAMRDLRALISEMDTAIRNGTSPPEDLVQRQESLDDRITQAGELVKSGK